MDLKKVEEFEYSARSFIYTINNRKVVPENFPQLFETLDRNIMETMQELLGGRTVNNLNREEKFWFRNLYLLHVKAFTFESEVKLYPSSYHVEHDVEKIFMINAGTEIDNEHPERMKIYVDEPVHFPHISLKWEVKQRKEEEWDTNVFFLCKPEGGYDSFDTSLKNPQEIIAKVKGSALGLQAHEKWEAFLGSKLLERASEKSGARIPAHQSVLEKLQKAIGIAKGNQGKNTRVEEAQQHQPKAKDEATL